MKRYNDLLLIGYISQYFDTILEYGEFENGGCVRVDFIYDILYEPCEDRITVTLIHLPYKLDRMFICSDCHKFKYLDTVLNMELNNMVLEFVRGVKQWQHS